MIEYIEADITSVTQGLICHGVNCLGVMGAGVALAIRNKWPQVYNSYKKMPFEEDLLGVTQIVTIDSGLAVANCFTQRSIGRTPGVKYASTDAIIQSVERCYEFCALYGMDLVSSKIGSQLGGLDWETEVRPIFEELNNDYEDVNTSIYYI